MEALLVPDLIAAVRDWAILVIAAVTLFYVWGVLRHLRRISAVYVDGQARRVSDKTYEITLRFRNQTAADMRLTRIAVRQPRPAIVAIKGVYDPGPGPVRCNFIVPAFAHGSLTILFGARPQGERQARLKVRYADRVPWWRRTVKRATVLVDLDAITLTDPREPPAQQLTQETEPPAALDAAAFDPVAIEAEPADAGPPSGGRAYVSERI